jgi:exodeoxyribonuclease VII small subunit
VSKAKNAGAVSAELQNLPFEEAIKRLEAIVESMESQELPLETLLARYEEGSALSQICQAKLAEAEVKIQQLDKTSKGELSLKPVNVPEQSQ